jgi:hypothetical protein
MSSTDIALFLGLEGPIYPSVPTSHLSLTGVSGEHQKIRNPSHKKANLVRVDRIL